MVANCDTQQASPVTCYRSVNGKLNMVSNCARQNQPRHMSGNVVMLMGVIF